MIYDIIKYYGTLFCFGYMIKSYVDSYLEYYQLKDSEEFNDELPYEQLYDVSFNELSKNKNNIDFEDLYIEEETPSGKIHMKYNKEGFFYYFTDAKTIPFYTLNSVAKKFTIDYDCRFIFVEDETSDEEEEEESQEEESQEDESQEDESQEEETIVEEKKNVFIKLKKTEKKINDNKVVRKNHFKKIGDLNEITKKTNIYNTKLSYQDYKNKQI